MKLPRQEDSDSNLSAAKFYIPTLPGLPSTSTLSQYGGHIPSSPPSNGKETQSETDAHLYFYLVKNRHISDRPRLLIWINGGPGCSSFDGALMEVGPLRLVAGGNGKLREVEGAWNEYTNILFIDQPVGTGYSYVNSNSYLHELPEAANHVMEFMKNWYKVFPEFINQDTFLGGESYAGQYIPYIADAILKSTSLPTKLEGLLIGNGWMDPIRQYPAYLEFAVQAGVIKKGSDIESQLKKQVIACEESMKKDGIENVKIHNSICENILSSITDSTIQNVNGMNMCVNNYDVRLTDTHPACGMNWPPDLADITPYLQRADVKTAFHANRHPGGWVECNGQVGSNFWAIKSKPSVNLLPSLLTKIPILFFAGDQDLICNHVGIERMIEALEWNGELGFGNVTSQEWQVDGKNAGSWTSARNLTYVKIAQASHMVPYDQPIASHDMLVRFLSIDLLGAAGPAAQIPSRVGNELEAVLGETHVNGSAVQDYNSNDSLDSGTTKGGIIPSNMSSEGLEGLVNIGSAMVLIFIMILVGGLFFCFKRRLRGSSRASNTAAMRMRAASGSMGRGQRRMEDELEEGDNELDELVASGYRDENKGKGREIFGLGDDEGDEDRKR